MLPAPRASPQLYEEVAQTISRQTGTPESPIFETFTNITLHSPSSTKDCKREECFKASFGLRSVALGYNPLFLIDESLNLGRVPQLKAKLLMGGVSLS